jgi:hypothetical protein
VSESCVKHPMAVAEFACGECGHDFCPECVVFPFGLKKPPLCISCALAKGGVSRRDTGRPKLSRRQVRQRLKARQQTTVVRSEIRTSGLGQLAEPPLPTLEEQQSDRWLEGDPDPEEFPGGWKQVF